MPESRYVAPQFRLGVCEAAGFRVSPSLAGAAPSWDARVPSRGPRVSVWRVRVPLWVVRVPFRGA
ncbi:hypothetical protein GCM10010174_80240 [Kutzneria viridogrisea]